MSRELVKNYYNAFNTKDMTRFASYLDENVAHDINQGSREIGKVRFMNFMEEMNRCYDEKVVDLVIMEGDQPGRFAAEFFIEGTYLKSQPGLPEAKMQKYRLPVGAFFEIKNGKVGRISNFYNLNDWIKQVQ